jgi:hypothetical protein
MKDALGHGSEGRGLHAGGVNKIGNLAVHPNALRTIQKNPWGASVKPQTGVSPTTGYMVSVPGRTQSPTSAALAGPQGAGIIRDYARTNSDLLQQPDAHIGSWTDDKTGKTHLDVSHNIQDRTEAIAAGRRGNQISIWDVARKKLINTGGTGD